MHILTDDDLTNDRIRALRREAAQHGDHAMALICDLAVGDVPGIRNIARLEVQRIASFIDKTDLIKIASMDRAACRARCLEVINAARGME